MTKMETVLVLIVISSCIVTISAQGDMMTNMYLLQMLRGGGSGGGSGGSSGAGSGGKGGGSSGGGPSSGQSGSSGYQSGRGQHGGLGGGTNPMMSMLMLGGGGDAMQDYMMCKMMFRGNSQLCLYQGM